MEKNWLEDRRHSVLLAILMSMAYGMLMFGNGIVSLTHPDEVFYIQSAKEMLAHKSWLTPMIFDDVQFEKPFLSFALFALAIKWFGLTPFAGRFWPSLFGMIGVVVVYWIGWMLFRSKRLAFFAGLVLSSSFIYMALSRAVLTDMIFSVLIAITLGFFCLAYYNRQWKNTGIILFFVFSAAAVLTKGILGFLFPATSVFFFLVYQRELPFMRCRAVLYGLAVFFALSLPWHIVMYARHGPWFLREYFFNVHWRRILVAEHARLDNWYFYLMLMFIGTMPWFLFWIPVGRCVYVQFKKKLASRDKLVFLVAWIVSIYIYMQPAHSKLASYILPAFFAISILLAYALDEALNAVRDGRRTPLISISAALMSVCLVAVACAGVIVSRRYQDILRDLYPFYFAAAALLGLALIIFVSSRRKRYGLVILAHLGVSIVLLGTLYFVRPHIEPWVSCKDIADILIQLDRSSTPVLTSKFYVRGIRFYTDRPTAVIDINGKGFWSPHPIPFLVTDQMVVNFLNERPVTWAVLKEGNVEDVRRILANRPFAVTELDDVGGKFILKIEKTG